MTKRWSFLRKQESRYSLDSRFRGNDEAVVIPADEAVVIPAEAGIPAFTGFPLSRE